MGQRAGRGQGIPGALSRLQGKNWGRTDNLAPKKSLLQQRAGRKPKQIKIQSVHQREKQEEDRRARGLSQEALPHVIGKPGILELSITDWELLGRAQGQGLWPFAGPDVLSTPLLHCYQARN